MSIEGEHFNRVEKMLANRNPNTSAEQRALLNNLTVRDVAALPPEIQAAYREHAEQSGIYTKHLDNNGKLQITHLPNGIVDIKHLKKYHRRVLVYPAYLLTSHYIVDTQSQKTFDVMQLLKMDDKGSKQSVDILVVPDMQEADYFAHTKEGDVILLGSHKASQKFHPDLARFAQLIAPLHETGHRWQSISLTGDHSLNESLLVTRYPLLYAWTVLKDQLLLWSNPTYKQERVLQRIQARKHRVWEERNAHAFTLALVRKLRTLGVDITRSMSVNDIIQSEDKMLQTYDSPKWLSTDRPLATLASQLYRRLRRGMDKSYRNTKP